MSETQLSLSASWPLPQAADISSAYSQSYAAAFPGCNPDQPNTFMEVQARIHGVVGFNLYLYQRSLADELMPDTARAWLPRHANQWGVPQIPAKLAIGLVIFTGPGNLPLPNGIELVGDDGTQWITTAAATIPAGSTTVTVPVAAEVAGDAGNCAAGTVLTIISPIVGLQNQTVTVGTGGIAGGADAEAISSWRPRILLRIRKRGLAGNVDDYIQWAEDAGAAPTPNVVRSWVGPGSVGIIIAMPNPAGGDRLVPTGAQVTAIQAAIDAVRPVTDQAVVVAAAQTPVPLTLALATDTVVNRALATSAAQAFIAAVAIGGVVDHSLLEDAMVQAIGGGVEVNVPPGNVLGTPTQMFTLGTVSFVAYE